MRPKSKRSDLFSQQISQSVAEFRAIMSAGQSPAADDRLTVRTLDVIESTAYDSNRVKKLRKSLNVSQAVFARLVGVSAVLVRSWERGARRPAPIARRLLDQIRAHPEQFADLVQISQGRSGLGQRAHNGKRAA
jgi:putative transcriptional regulator